MHFPNIFYQFETMLTSLRFSLISFLSFLHKEVISARLRISGNNGNFMELPKLVGRTLLEISVFSFTIFLEYLGFVMSYLYLPLKSCFHSCFPYKFNNVLFLVFSKKRRKNLFVLYNVSYVP